MFRIAILGVENSHANSFLNYVVKDKLYPDIEVVGVWSDEAEPLQKIVDDYGVPAMSAPDELVGKIDGLVVTSRRGSYHYKMAKPYISSGIPMFIDKPITSDPAEAVEFMKELKAAGVRATGGSSLIHSETIVNLKGEIAKPENGPVIGGFMRGPILPDSPYDGFYFYCMHLVQSMQELFGYYPLSVRTFTREKVFTSVVHYDDFEVAVEFVRSSNMYRAFVSTHKGFAGDNVSVGNREFSIEFKKFHELLLGGEMEQSYRDFIAPVFVADAIIKSIDTCEEVKISYPDEI
ncbi:MAG: Gfo/Idh/MocA family oxidoreductase [Clostridia bacterium]|nr:Gfo/Idh/MocA family oxidoreductase [Clostridia bacterium]